MADKVGKPLSRSQWSSGLRDVTRGCDRGSARDQAKLIRKMRDLMARAPEGHALAGLTVPGVARLEAMFATGCWDSAALAMLGTGTGYLLSRGERGRHLATVLLPGRIQETIFAGDTLALALVGAMASALSEEAMAAYPEQTAGVPRHLH